MELEEFRQAWHALDDQLKKQDLIDREQLQDLIDRKYFSVERRINRLRKYNIIAVTLSYILIGILGIFILNSNYMEQISYLYIILYFMVLPVLGWDIYTLRFLNNIRIEELPLATVIARVNRYNHWMIKERLIGFGILLILALLHLFTGKAWATSLWLQLLLFGVWLAALLIVIRITNKIYLVRIREIRKNLSELQELDQL